MKVKLSDNFWLSEFVESDTANTRGIANNINNPDHLDAIIHTARSMEIVRAILGNTAITITSGYRNPELNKAVGGVSNSDHALGYACDFKHGFMTPANAMAIISSRAGDYGLRYDQIINEFDNWVHISFNPRYRRQNLIASKVAGKTEYRVV